MSIKPVPLAVHLNEVLARFDVPGVVAVPAAAPGWAVLRVSDGTRPMPEILAAMDSACTALQVDGPYLMSFCWTNVAPAPPRELNINRWPAVEVKRSEVTPLDGALVVDFCSRAAVRNWHY